MDPGARRRIYLGSIPPCSNSPLLRSSGARFEMSFVVAVTVRGTDAKSITGKPVALSQYSARSVSLSEQQ